MFRILSTRLILCQGTVCKGDSVKGGIVCGERSPAGMIVCQVRRDCLGEGRSVLSDCVVVVNGTKRLCSGGDWCQMIFWQW